MKTAPGTIVVGVDGSDSASRALDWAADQARAEHRPITVVHTVNAVTPGWVDQAIAEPGEANLALRDEAQKVLTEAHERVTQRAPDVEVQEIFSLEDPREVLLDLSAAAQMIVLGSHGRGTVRRLLLGSVGVALARHADCPVVVHRPGRTGTVRHGIAVGADGSPESRIVLEFAYRQAALHDLPLTVMHCFWDVQALVTDPHLVRAPGEDLEQERLLLAEAMAGLAEKHPDVRVQVELARGVAEHALVALSERMNLLVLGARQEGFSSRLLFGSVSVPVLERASCPVAVVPLTDRS